jgi:hypothetical protein
VPLLPEVSVVDAEVLAEVEPDSPEAPQAVSTRVKNDSSASAPRRVVVLIIGKCESMVVTLSRVLGS